MEGGPSPELAAVISDWDVVHQAAENAGQNQLAVRAAKKARVAHRRWQSLLQFEAGGGLYDDLLYALAHAGVEDLSDWLIEALTRSHVAVTAVEIISGDPGWQKQLERLFQKTIGDKSFSHARAATALALAEGGADVKNLLDTLLSKPAQYVAAMSLALKRGPEHLMPIVRLALRSKFPWDRATAAAILARLDTSASRQELLEILKSDDLDATIECRAALRECGGMKEQFAVEGWEAAHPDEEAPPFGTDRGFYRLEGGAELVIRKKMLELAEIADQVRELISPNSSDKLTLVERAASITLNYRNY